MKKFSKKKQLNSYCVKVVNPLEKEKKQVRNYRTLENNWKEKLLALPVHEKEMKMLLYCTQGNRNLVKLLNESEPKIDINCTYMGDNGLTLAARKGDFTTVKYLVNHGIDIDFIGADGKTALHTYAKKGMENNCKFLLDNFASPNLCGAYQQTPVFDAVIFNKIEIIKLLKIYDADLDFQNEDGVTPMMIACQSAQRQESLLTLLELGANIEVKDFKGQRALTYAIKSNNRQFIDILLKRKCNINYQDINGTTPLMLAAKYGQRETLRVLLTRGADPYATDDDGHTAYDYAERNEHNGSMDIIRAAIKHLENGDSLDYLGKQNRIQNSCVR